MKKLIAIFALLLPAFLSGQHRDFSEWEATAFCSYTEYHPFRYIRADNNWEIIQALSVPRTKEQLDSLGIAATTSQLMLLHIEGLLERDELGRWRSLMPVLDSLQTVAAREFSRALAEEIYPYIENECRNIVETLAERGQADNSFAVIFAYVLDGRIWDSFGSFEDNGSSATWDGCCWALYDSRPLQCGTNSFNGFSVCWTDDEPDFLWEELNPDSFIVPFVEDYEKHGRLTDTVILSRAMAVGLAGGDGSLHVPVLDPDDKNCPVNIAADKIIDAVSDRFRLTAAVDRFRDKFGIPYGRGNLACTMLYHEVMWDLTDMLLTRGIVSLPKLWSDRRPESIYSVVIYEK